MAGVLFITGCAVSEAVRPREIGWAPAGYQLRAGEHPWPWGREGPTITHYSDTQSNCTESWGQPGNASSVCQPPTFWRTTARGTER